ncbi:MAG: hypothetical protein J07HQW1_00528 [Haloquadratum walsbyi J07HQW1]|uniref:Uncharacterized protein n=1 Tax=Haloquadratum walsbyi J07HQW1 TaxID=1238424 RepID=U1N1Z3_9EURY|nr:MAG: hypothetical protein J07HQW1_00528 [Haloquadratum walsbyi J07HQW1]
MAKDTRRDRIWRIALTTDGFTKQYIEDQVDASSRTVHDVLKTMVDYRFLKQKTQYRKVEQGSSSINSTNTNTSTSTKQDVTVYHPLDIRPTPPEPGFEDDISSENIFSSGATLEANTDMFTGVGEKRLRKLEMERLVTLNDILDASINEIAEVDGFGEQTAKTLKITTIEAAINKLDMSEEDLRELSVSEYEEMFNLREEYAEELKQDLNSTLL